MYKYSIYYTSTNFNQGKSEFASFTSDKIYWIEDNTITKNALCGYLRRVVFKGDREGTDHDIFAYDVSIQIQEDLKKIFEGEDIHYETIISLPKDFKSNTNFEDQKNREIRATLYLSRKTLGADDMDL